MSNLLSRRVLRKSIITRAIFVCVWHFFLLSIGRIVINEFAHKDRMKNCTRKIYLINEAKLFHAIIHSATIAANISLLKRIEISTITYRCI